MDRWRMNRKDPTGETDDINIIYIYDFKKYTQNVFLKRFLI